MVIVGILVTVGLVLLVAQLVFGGALNDATDDGPLSLVPLTLGLMCFWIAFWRGLAKGSAATILAVLLGLGSLLLFGYAVLALYPSVFSRTVYLAASASLSVLAVTMGIFAYANERATNRESSGRE